MKRRDVMRMGTNMATLAVLPRIPSGRWAASVTRSPRTLETALPSPDVLTTLYDPAIQAMARQAVEAAQRAGASYSDVRCTNIIFRECPGSSAAVTQSVKLAMSVRSLVNGYWGWSSTNMLAPSEAVRVGQLSAQLATESATRGRPRTVELGTIPIVKNQTWKTPVQIDPFDLKLTEVYDWLNGVVTHLANRGYGISVGMQSNQFGVAFSRAERLFASSEGSLTTQTIRTLVPKFSLAYQGQTLSIPGYGRAIQGGWERMARGSNDELYAMVEQAREAADRSAPLSLKPADMGRYDIVYSASAMAALLESTLVRATEVDRAMGYEANASGTSYLGPDPLAFLGTQVASPAVTVTAERSTPDALATVKWDDDGIAPEPFTLVKDGILVDYQTTREQAAWLAPWYRKQGRPVQSHGCAGAPSAGFVTMQHTPNIILQPSSTSADEESLIAQMGTGLYIPGLGVEIDFQCTSGLGTTPVAVEIRNGKRTGFVAFSGGLIGTLFRATDLWKNVSAIGGAGSAKWFNGTSAPKGEPDQRTAYSICAVPALVKAQAIIDPTKKA